MTRSAESALRRAQGLRASFGADMAAEKCALLRVLEQSRLSKAADVVRLHDLLCFMRAYPDNAEVLAIAEDILSGFRWRKDLVRHSDELADTGIVGTAIYYSFYWLTARWLVERWPGAITIDWAVFDNQDKLEELLPLLLPPCEAQAIESVTLSPKEWIDRLKGQEETDAVFLIQRFTKWGVNQDAREKIYEDLDVPLCLAPGVDTPSRTHSKYRVSNTIFQNCTPTRPSVSNFRELHYQPVSHRVVSPREGQWLIDLARVQMITRGRDLFAFMNADHNDVHILDYGGGLQFACYGLRPVQRLFLEAMYVFLILKNGVPIGYTQASALFRSAEINFNIFDTYRGMETSHVFSTTLNMVRYLFKPDTFIINTQQLGEDNPEALKTGAFWFYYKHGFRPRSGSVRETMKKELARKKIKPNYRSGLATLKQLSRDNLFLSLDKPREDTVSMIDTGRIGLACSRLLARQYGAQREHGIRDCAQRLAERVGLASLNSLSRSQRIAWDRWSPMLMMLPGLSQWSAENKRGLIEIVKAKGGRSEIEFVTLFDNHRLLWRAIWKLSASEECVLKRPA